MSLNSTNQKILDDMGKGLSGVSRQVTQYSQERAVQSKEQYLNLHNLVLTLSIAIAGIVIPILVGQAQPNAKIFFVVSLIILGLDVLYGIIILSLTLSQEQIEIRATQKKLLDLVEFLQTKLKELGATGDDRTIGTEIEKLKPEYDRAIDSIKKKMGWREKYEDVIFYGAFSTAFIALLVGLMFNFY